MNNNDQHQSINGVLVFILVLVNILVLKVAYIVDSSWYSGLIITLPLLLATKFFGDDE